MITKLQREKKKETKSGVLALKPVAFSGRTLKEYELIFGIKAEDFEGKRVLDCASGASSFTAEAWRRNIASVGVDPLYVRKAEGLEKIARMDLYEKGEGNDPFVEKSGFPEISPENAISPGMGREDDQGMAGSDETTLRYFVQDYPGGRASGRYLSGALPNLPLNNNRFHLVLCSHFLFLYSDRLDYEFHFAACRELCRICCGEVRVSPLTDLHGVLFPFLNRLLKDLHYCGILGKVIEIENRKSSRGRPILVLRRRFNFT